MRKNGTKSACAGKRSPRRSGATAVAADGHVGYFPGSDVGAARPWCYGVVMKAVRRSVVVLVAIILGIPLSGGCAALDNPAATWQRWMAQSRRDAADAVKEIKKDWDLHEGEGLENFGGGAAEQVRELRGELDRSTTMSSQ